MKKFNFTIMRALSICGYLFLGVLFSSCLQNDSIEDSFPQFIIEQKEITLSVSSEAKPESKTVLDNDYVSVLWKPSDEIKIFSAGEASKFTSTNTENAKTVNFTGTISVITGTAEGTVDSNIYGLYPFTNEASFSNGQFTTTLPAVQNAVANSFDDDLFISIGKSETYSMGFYNVCSGLRFSFSEGGYTSVTLSSNNGEALAGTFTVGFDENGKPDIKSIGSPYTSITVNAPNGGFAVDTWYYIVCLPGSYNGGITISASNSVTLGTYTIETPISFSRSLMKQITELDGRLTFPEPQSFVDLGLSVLWSNRNVGAVNDNDSGGLFAWGETETKDTYSWSNYKWKSGNYLTKYCLYSNEGSPDGRSELEEEDDAATMFWGNGAKTPSLNNYKELVDFCTWTWDNTYGGYIITSNIDGYTDKSIFLPAINNYGCYMTREYDGRESAEVFTFSETYILPSSSYATSERCAGHSVRGVRNPEEERVIPIIEWSLSKESIQIPKNGYRDLSINVIPSYSSYSIAVTASNNSIVSISPNGSTYRITGTNGGFTTLTISLTNGNHVFTKNCEVSVIEPVDLGLSVKWANINLGQTSATKPGNRYAWGETSPKTSFSWSNYLYGDSWYTPTKYNSSPDYGPVDNKTTLDLADDAAYVSYPTHWRMPTWGEIMELINYCSWVYQGSQEDRMAGHIVTSNKVGYSGATIYVPIGNYWSSTTASDDEIYPTGAAWYLNVEQELWYEYDYRWCERYVGNIIRPVYDY